MSHKTIILCHNKKLSSFLRNLREPASLKEDLKIDNVKIGFVEKADFLASELPTDGRIGLGISNSPSEPAASKF